MSIDEMSKFRKTVKEWAAPEFTQSKIYYNEDIVKPLLETLKSIAEDNQNPEELREKAQNALNEFMAQMKED